MLSNVVRGNEWDIVLGIAIAYILVKFYPTEDEN